MSNEITEGIKETSEAILSHIDETKKQIAAAKNKEEKKEKPELVVLPLANVHIKIGHGQSIWKNNITPPELAILCASLFDVVGTLPVEEIVLNEEKKQALLDKAKNETGPAEKEVLLQQASSVETEVKVDPSKYKLKLLSGYRDRIVQKLFSEEVPTYPKTFKDALLLVVPASK